MPKQDPTPRAPEGVRAAPPVQQQTSPAARTSDRDRGRGGSYIRDPVTGVRRLLERTRT